MAGDIPTPAPNIVNHFAAKSATQHNNSHEIQERELSPYSHLQVVAFG